MSNSQQYNSVISERSRAVSMLFGTIVAVDGAANSGAILFNTDGQEITKQVDLPTFCSPDGIGLRFTPYAEANTSHAIRIYQEAGEYAALGYTPVNATLIDNKDNTGFQGLTPLRYLYPGEVSINSGLNSELFMNKEGGVILSDTNFDAIEIDPNMGTIITSAANTRHELDSVRIRAGNIIRPVDPITTDEIYLIKDGSDQQHEFLVEVGNRIDSDGNESTRPSVGIMGLGTRIYDEQGRFFQLGANDAQFLVKTASGGGIGISSTGSIYFIDYNSGSSTVFGGGENGDKWIRAGANAVCISATTGISLNHALGSNIDLSMDGAVTMVEYTKGYHIQVTSTGLNLDCGIAKANYTAGIHNVMGDMAILGTVSIGVMPSYSVIKAAPFGLFFDVHVHAGPGAPPSIPLSTFLSVPGNPYCALNFNVS